VWPLVVFVSLPTVALAVTVAVRGLRRTWTPVWVIDCGGGPTVRRTSTHPAGPSSRDIDELIAMSGGLALAWWPSYGRLTRKP
jgi:hypothetical protein